MNVMALTAALAVIDQWNRRDTCVELDLWVCPVSRMSETRVGLCDCGADGAIPENQSIILDPSSIASNWSREGSPFDSLLGRDVESPRSITFVLRRVLYEWPGYLTSLCWLV